MSSTWEWNSSMYLGDKTAADKSEAREPKCIPQLCHGLVLWPWASHCTSLSLRFLIHKMGGRVTIEISLVNLEGSNMFIHVNHKKECLKHSKQSKSVNYCYVLLKKPSFSSTFLHICWEGSGANSGSPLLPSQTQYPSWWPATGFFSVSEKRVSKM